MDDILTFLLYIFLNCRWVFYTIAECRALAGVVAHDVPFDAVCELRRLMEVAAVSSPTLDENSAVRGSQLFTSKGCGEGRARLHFDDVLIEAGMEQHEFAALEAKRRGDTAPAPYAFRMDSAVRFCDSGSVGVDEPSASGPIILHVGRWEADDTPSIWSFRNVAVDIARFPTQPRKIEAYYDAVPVKTYGTVHTVLAIGRLGVQLTLDAQIDVVAGDLHCELWNRAHAYSQRHTNAVAFAHAAITKGSEKERSEVEEKMPSLSSKMNEAQPDQFNVPQAVHLHECCISQVEDLDAIAATSRGQVSAQMGAIGSSSSSASSPPSVSAAYPLTPEPWQLRDYHDQAPGREWTHSVLRIAEQGFTRDSEGTPIRVGVDSSVAACMGTQGVLLVVSDVQISLPWLAAAKAEHAAGESSSRSGSGSARAFGVTRREVAGEAVPQILAPLIDTMVSAFSIAVPKTMGVGAWQPSRQSNEHGRGWERYGRYMKPSPVPRPTQGVWLKLARCSVSLASSPSDKWLRSSQSHWRRLLCSERSANDTFALYRRLCARSRRAQLSAVEGSELATIAIESVALALHIDDTSAGASARICAWSDLKRADSETMRDRTILMRATKGIAANIGVWGVALDLQVTKRATLLRRRSPQRAGAPLLSVDRVGVSVALVMLPVDALDDEESAAPPVVLPVPTAPVRFVVDGVDLNCSSNDLCAASGIVRELILRLEMPSATGVVVAKRRQSWSWRERKLAIARHARTRYWCDATALSFTRAFAAHDAARIAAARVALETSSADSDAAALAQENYEDAKSRVEQLFQCIALGGRYAMSLVEHDLDAAAIASRVGTEMYTAASATTGLGVTPYYWKCVGCANVGFQLDLECTECGLPRTSHAVAIFEPIAVPVVVIPRAGEEMQRARAQRRESRRESRGANSTSGGAAPFSKGRAASRASHEDERREVAAVMGLAALLTVELDLLNVEAVLRSGATSPTGEGVAGSALDSHLDTVRISLGRFYLNAAVPTLTFSASDATEHGDATESTGECSATLTLSAISASIERSDGAHMSSATRPPLVSLGETTLLLRFAREAAAQRPLLSVACDVGPLAMFIGAADFRSWGQWGSSWSTAFSIANITPKPKRATVKHAAESRSGDGGEDDSARVDVFALLASGMPNIDVRRLVVGEVSATICSQHSITEIDTEELRRWRTRGTRSVPIPLRGPIAEQAAAAASAVKASLSASRVSCALHVILCKSAAFAAALRHIGGDSGAPSADAGAAASATLNSAAWTEMGLQSVPSEWVGDLANWGPNRGCSIAWANNDAETAEAKTQVIRLSGIMLRTCGTSARVLSPLLKGAANGNGFMVWLPSMSLDSERETRGGAGGSAAGQVSESASPLHPMKEIPPLRRNLDSLSQSSSRYTGDFEEAHDDDDSTASSSVFSAAMAANESMPAAIARMTSDTRERGEGSMVITVDGLRMLATAATCQAMRLLVDSVQTQLRSARWGEWAARPVYSNDVSDRHRYSATRARLSERLARWRRRPRSYDDDEFAAAPASATTGTSIERDVVQALEAYRLYMLWMHGAAGVRRLKRKKENAAVAEALSLSGSTSASAGEVNDEEMGLQIQEDLDEFDIFKLIYKGGFLQNAAVPVTAPTPTRAHELQVDDGTSGAGSGLLFPSQVAVERDANVAVGGLYTSLHDAYDLSNAAILTAASQFDDTLAEYDDSEPSADDGRGSGLAVPGSLDAALSSLSRSPPKSPARRAAAEDGARPNAVALLASTPEQRIENSEKKTSTNTKKKKKKKKTPKHLKTAVKLMRGLFKPKKKKVKKTSEGAGAAAGTAAPRAAPPVPFLSPSNSDGRPRTPLQSTLVSAAAPTPSSTSAPAAATAVASPTRTTAAAATTSTASAAVATATAAENVSESRGSVEESNLAFVAVDAPTPALTSESDAGVQGLTAWQLAQLVAKRDAKSNAEERATPLFRLCVVDVELVVHYSEERSGCILMWEALDLRLVRLRQSEGEVRAPAPGASSPRPPHGNFVDDSGWKIVANIDRLSLRIPTIDIVASQPIWRSPPDLRMTPVAGVDTDHRVTQGGSCKAGVSAVEFWRRHGRDGGKGLSARTVLDRVMPVALRAGHGTAAEDRVALSLVWMPSQSVLTGNAELATIDIAVDTEQLRLIHRVFYANVSAGDPTAFKGVAWWGWVQLRRTRSTEFRRTLLVLTHSGMLAAYDDATLRPIGAALVVKDIEIDAPFDIEQQQHCSDGDVSVNQTQSTPIMSSFGATHSSSRARAATAVGGGRSGGGGDGGAGLHAISPSLSGTATRARAMTSHGGDSPMRGGTSSKMMRDRELSLTPEKLGKSHTSSSGASPGKRTKAKTLKTPAKSSSAAMAGAARSRFGIMLVGRTWGKKPRRWTIRLHSERDFCGWARALSRFLEDSGGALSAPTGENIVRAARYQLKRAFGTVLDPSYAAELRRTARRDHEPLLDANVLGVGRSELEELPSSVTFINHVAVRSRLPAYNEGAHRAALKTGLGSMHRRVKTRRNAGGGHSAGDASSVPTDLRGGFVASESSSAFVATKVFAAAASTKEASAGDNNKDGMKKREALFRGSATWWHRHRQMRWRLADITRRRKNREHEMTPSVRVATASPRGTPPASPQREQLDSGDDGGGGSGGGGVTASLPLPDRETAAAATAAAPILRGVLRKKTFGFDRSVKRRYFVLNPSLGIMEYYETRADYLAAVSENPNEALVSSKAYGAQSSGAGVMRDRSSTVKHQHHKHQHQLQQQGGKKSAKRIIDLAQCTKLQWADPESQLVIDLVLTNFEHYQLSSANFGPGPFEAPAAARRQVARWFSAIAVCTACALQRRAPVRRRLSQGDNVPASAPAAASSNPRSVFASNAADVSAAAAHTESIRSAASMTDDDSHAEDALIMMMCSEEYNDDAVVTLEELRETEVVLRLACALLQARLEGSVMEANSYSLFDRKMLQLQRQLKLPPIEISIEASLTATLFESDERSGGDADTSARASDVNKESGEQRPRAPSDARRASYDDDELASLVFAGGSLFDGRLARPPRSVSPDAATAQRSSGRHGGHRRSHSMPHLGRQLDAKDLDAAAGLQPPPTLSPPSWVGGGLKRESPVRWRSTATSAAVRNAETPLSAQLELSNQRRAFGSLDVGPIVIRAGSFGDGSLSFEAELVHAIVTNLEEKERGAEKGIVQLLSVEALRPAVPLAQRLQRQNQSAVERAIELRARKQRAIIESSAGGDAWSTLAEHENAMRPASMAAREMCRRAESKHAQHGKTRAISCWWRAEHESTALSDALATRRSMLEAMAPALEMKSSLWSGSRFLETEIRESRARQQSSSSRRPPPGRVGSERGAQQALVSASASLDEVGWRNVIRMFRMRISPLDVQLTERWVKKLVDFFSLPTLEAPDSYLAQLGGRSIASALRSTRGKARGQSVSDELTAKLEKVEHEHPDRLIVKQFELMPLNVLASYSRGTRDEHIVMQRRHLSLEGLRYPLKSSASSLKRSLPINEGDPSSEAISLPSAISFFKMLGMDILRGLLRNLPQMLGEVLVQTFVSALPGLRVAIESGSSGSESASNTHGGGGALSSASANGSGSGGGGVASRMAVEEATEGEGGGGAAANAAAVEGARTGLRSAMPPPSPATQEHMLNQRALLDTWRSFLSRHVGAAMLPRTLWNTIAVASSSSHGCSQPCRGGPGVLTPGEAVRARAGGECVRGWLRVVELTAPALLELRVGFGLAGASSSRSTGGSEGHPSLTSAAPRALRVRWCVLRKRTLYVFTWHRGASGGFELVPEAALPLLGASLEPLNAAPSTSRHSAVAAAASAMELGATPFGCTVLGRRGGALALAAESASELCAWVAAIGLASQRG